MQTQIEQFVDVTLPEHRMMAQGRRLAMLRTLLEEPDSADLPRRGHHITQDVPHAAKEAVIVRLYQNALHRRFVDIPDGTLHRERLVRARHHTRRLPV